MSKKNPNHPRHNRHHRNVSAPTRARDPGREFGHDTAGWHAIKTAAGAAGAALACAFVARKDWLPPKLITGVVSVLGAVFAVGGRSDTLRAVGAGAMSAAGAQLGLMLLDDHYQATRRPVTMATKPFIADRLPPGALEFAFARTRARLGAALSGAAPPSDRRNAAEPPLGATAEAMHIPRTAKADVLDLATAAPRYVMDTRVFPPALEVFQDTQAPRDPDVMHDASAHRDTQTIQDTRGAQSPRDAEVTHGALAAQATVTHDVGAPDATQAAHGVHATQSAPTKPDISGAPAPANKPQPVDDLIASICAAVERGASAEVRDTGAAACRAILTVLEAQVGQPLAAASPVGQPLAAAPTTAPSSPSPLASLLSQLAAMPREQLIDFFSSRVRGALAAARPTQFAPSPRYHFVPISQVAPRGGVS